MCGAEGPYGVSMGLRGFYGVSMGLGVFYGVSMGLWGPYGVFMGLMGGGEAAHRGPQSHRKSLQPHTGSPSPLTLVDADVMAAGPAVVPPPPLPPSARRRRRSASASMVAAARGAQPASPGGGRAHFRSSPFRFRYLPFSLTVFSCSTPGRLALLPAYRKRLPVGSALTPL